MPVSKIPGFRTSDGALFDNEEAAEDYELKLKLRVWYEDHYLSSDFSRVDFDDMVDWLRANATEVKKLLKVIT